MDCPNQLNLGSGKDFRQDYLNLDSDASWRPDVTADFNHPFLPEGVGKFNTERFGEIEILNGSFNLIIAYDVMEHIGNLPLAMKNCLDLLEYQGILDIISPYELSLGAWQDPTHVRALNEKSWIYYTDWFWYFGWNQARFVIENLAFSLNEFGTALSKNENRLENILRVPRAVEAMNVKLRKVPLSSEDLLELNKFRPERRF